MGLIIRSFEKIARENRKKILQNPSFFFTDVSKEQAGARRVREGGGAHAEYIKCGQIGVKWMNRRGGLDEMQKMRRKTARVLLKTCLAFWDLTGAIIMP